MSLKNELIELYEDSMLLGKYTELEYVTDGMKPALHPKKDLNDLTEAELVGLIKAVITGMTSQLC